MTAEPSYGINFPSSVTRFMLKLGSTVTLALLLPGKSVISTDAEIPIPTTFISKRHILFIGPHGDIRSRSLNGNAAQTVHSGRRGIEAHLYGGRFAVQRDKIRGRIDQSDLSAPQHHAVGLHHKKAFVEGLHRFVVIEPVEGLTLLLALCAFRFADRLAVIGRLCRDSCKEQAQQADQYHIPYHIVCVLNLRIA